MLSKLQLYIILFLFVVLSSCLNVKSDGVDLLSKAQLVHKCDSNGNIEALTLKFKSVQKINDEYLYIISTNANFKVTLNNLTDTIAFNNVELRKLPFNNVRVIPQSDLYFKWINLPEMPLAELTLYFVKPKSIKDTKIQALQLVNEKQFNKKFDKFELFTQSRLPVLKIVSDSSICSKNQIVTLTVYNKNTNLNDTPFYSGLAKFKIRGSSSKLFQKKGFKLELIDSIQRNQALLGMPSEHDWVLHGPYVDISHIRNKFAYDLARDMGQYAPRIEYCELIINNEYEGLYLLTESIKVDKNRVNLKKADLTNNELDSYIIKIDRGDDVLFQSDYKSKIDSGWNQFFKSFYPKASELSAKQIKGIKTDITLFETSLLKNNSEYINYIDLESFVDYFIINELTKNIDAYRLSTFMFKNSSGKLQMGPVWDFNFSLGLTEHIDGYKHDGWIFQFEAVPFWWQQLLKKQEFRELLFKRWIELRKETLSTNTIFSKIDGYYCTIEPVKDRNFIRWNVFNDHLVFRYKKVQSLEEEIELIKTWIELRLKWIDENLRQL